MHDLLVKNARLYPMVEGAEAASETGFCVSGGSIAAMNTGGPARETFDAKGRIVMPGLVDCHTHALYAGNRMNEHSMKLRGASYEEIARAGGGILSTVRAVRRASEDELVSETLPRLRALMREGVTSVEVKSGYGLTLPDELKMLKAVDKLRAHSPLNIEATFLGAHAVPEGKTRQQYMNDVVDRMLPEVARQGLARSVDIFVESIGFEIEDMERLFERARDLGFGLRVHAEQLSNMGAAKVAARLGARSCDHVEYVDNQAIDAMGRAGTVAVLLPGAYYFLRETQKPPVSSFRRANVAMAVATDLNPGSSPIASLLTNMHMAAQFFSLTAEEVLLGVTRNAARALGREDTYGSLQEGRQADFCVWDIPAPEFLTYQLGGIEPDAIFIRGNRIK